MNPEDISFRAATPQDEEFLRRLFYVVREPEFAAAGMPPDQIQALLAQQYGAMRAYYAEVFPETVYSILEHESEQIGYEAVRKTHELHLVDIALLPEYRNQGIGTYRMNRLQALAREAGMGLLLSVEVFNPAKRLYDRLGFKVIDEKEIFLRMLWKPEP